MPGIKCHFYFYFGNGFAGTGLVSSGPEVPKGSSGDSSLLSPASPKVMKPRKDSTPYWSPASQQSQGNISGDPATRASQLAVSAKEFVPSNTVEDESFNSGGLSSTANEWVPPKVGASHNYSPEHQTESSPANTEESMVEVICVGLRSPYI